MGWFVDKFGPRNVMLFGTGLTALGFILLSRIQELWQFYAAFLVLTIGLSFGTFLIVTTAVANWFVENRSKALSITMAGSGLGGVLVPVIIWLIATTDWRTGLVVVAIGHLVIGIPVSFVMKSRPEDYGLLPDGALPEEPDELSGSEDAARRRTALSSEVNMTTRQALTSRVFWQLAIAMGVSGMVISASIHQIPAITSFGISRNIAGFRHPGCVIIQRGRTPGQRLLRRPPRQASRNRSLALLAVCRNDGLRVQQRAMASRHLHSLHGASGSARPYRCASRL